jgi:hypothetical protein
MQTHLVKHGYLLFLTFDQIHNLTGKTVGQFLKLAAIIVTATAISDDLIDIVRRDIATTDIAIIIAFTVKGTNVFISHDNLICETGWFDNLPGEKARLTGSSSHPDLSHASGST